MSPRSAAFKSYLRYLNPDLPGSEQDRYYSEIALVAERLGARAAARPRADRRLPGGHASTPALRRTHPRSGADSLQRTSAQHPGQPFGALMLRAGAELLPDWAGSMLDLPFSPLQRRLIRGSVRRSVPLAALGGAQRFDASSLPAHGSAASEPLNFRAVTARIPVQRL